MWYSKYDKKKVECDPSSATYIHSPTNWVFGRCVIATYKITWLQKGMKRTSFKIMPLGWRHFRPLVDWTKKRYPDFPEKQFFSKLSRGFRRISSYLVALSGTWLPASRSSYHRFGRLLNRLPDLSWMNSFIWSQTQRNRLAEYFLLHLTLPTEL